MDGKFDTILLYVFVGRFFYDDTGNWTAFWWFDANTLWPVGENDVLAYDFGHCKVIDPYCFGRLPLAANEDSTEMLAVDTYGTIYKWSFDLSNTVAHAAWRAFHDHQITLDGEVKNQASWSPQVLQGNAPAATQDSFMYRYQDGVKSVLLDDDACDCKSSLSIGHGLCNSGYNTNFGPRGQYGVDSLYDPGCQVPRAGVGLTLFFRTG